MILELPKLSKEQYEKQKEGFYKKLGKIPIEIELEDYQKDLLLNQNFNILPKFFERLEVYTKSLLLKTLKGSSNYIQEAKVDALVEKAVSNFIKRYFRAKDCVVGASFAGILQFKIQEVLSNYFKNSALESNVSLDAEIGNSSSENNVLTVGQLLDYKHYENYTVQEEPDAEERAQDVYAKVEEEVEAFKKINTVKNLNKYFLQYLIYLYLLQSTRVDKRVFVVSEQAIKLITNESAKAEKLTPFMESGLLDVSEN